MVLRKTNAIGRTIAIERGISHKKEVRVAFGVISDTARREIGFNVYFFSAIQQKNIGCPSPRPTFERTTSNRYFSTAVFSIPSKFYCIDHWRGCKISPRSRFFLPVSFFFLIAAARFVLRKFDIAQRSMGARIRLCQLTYPVAY